MKIINLHCVLSGFTKTASIHVFREGDELATIIPLTRENYQPLAEEVIAQGERCSSFEEIESRIKHLPA